MTAVPSLTGVWLGRRRYAPTLALQREWFELRKQGQASDVVFCLEHEPVITLGRGAQPEHLLVDRRHLNERGIDVETTDRGGEITVHAPGQLVCYPIVSLAPDRCDVRRYVKDLTATMQSLVAEQELQAGELPGLVGLWVDEARPWSWRGETAVERPAKIGAIGVKLSRWVAMHGFALNLDPDLALFRLIVPCGISDRGVCSVRSLGLSALTPRAAAARAVPTLAARLGRGSVPFLDAEGVADADVSRWLRERL